MSATKFDQIQTADNLHFKSAITALSKINESGVLNHSRSSSQSRYLPYSLQSSNESIENQDEFELSMPAVPSDQNNISNYPLLQREHHRSNNYLKDFRQSGISIGQSQFHCNRSNLNCLLHEDNNSTCNSISTQPNHHRNNYRSLSLKNEEPKHPLANIWCLFMLQDAERRTRESWKDSQAEVHKFQTVEDFWCMVNHIHPPSHIGITDYSLFKKSIKPAWEDVAVAQGGRWVAKLPIKLRSLDELWLHVVMAMIGESYFGDYSHHVCGVVVSVRPRSLKLSVWINCRDIPSASSIGMDFQSLLQQHLLEYKDEKFLDLSFQSFKDSIEYCISSCEVFTVGEPQQPSCLRQVDISTADSMAEEQSQTPSHSQNLYNQSSQLSQTERNQDKNNNKSDNNNDNNNHHNSNNNNEFNTINKNHTCHHDDINQYDHQNSISSNEYYPIVEGDASLISNHHDFNKGNRSLNDHENTSQWPSRQTATAASISSNSDEYQIKEISE